MGEAAPMGQVQAILPQLKISDAIGAAISNEHECVCSRSACQLIHFRPVAQQVISAAAIEGLLGILGKQNIGLCAGGCAEAEGEVTYAGLRARDCEQLNIAANDVDIDIRNAADRHVELICDGVQVDQLPIVQKSKQ